MSRARVGGGRGPAAESPESAHDDGAPESMHGGDTELPPEPIAPGDFADTEPPPAVELDEEVPVRVDTKRRAPKSKKARPGYRWVKALCTLRRADGDVPAGTVLELDEAEFRHFLTTGAVAEHLE